MTWHVARAITNAQSSRHQYRFDDLSPVEQALRRNGFDFYMPVKKVLARRHRGQSSMFKELRFPAIEGYVFVRNVLDFRRLEKETPGIIGVVRFEGRPYPLPEADIENLKRIEAECEHSFQRDAARRAFAASKMTRNKAKHLFPSGSHVMVTAGHLSGREGFVSGFERDGKVRLMLSMLNHLSVALPVNDLQLVAA